jgi:glutamate 5-kinase
MLLQNNKSLLAVGIRSAEGDFKFGDVVDVLDEKGRTIARGLTNYSREDLERIKGLKSGEIQRALGSRPYDEVVHRDNLVLLAGADE